jgi:undecaprenyl pyrophosphate synthase
VTPDAAVAPEAVLDADLPTPTHVAIIMDGNGRWAGERGMPREAGHRAGTENVRDIIRASAAEGVYGTNFCVEKYTEALQEYGWRRRRFGGLASARHGNGRSPD